SGTRYGGGDLNWRQLIPGTIRSILRGKRPVLRCDGTNDRDSFYVEDGAATNMAPAEGLARDFELRGEAFNFSNELQMTVLEVVERILGLMGSDLEPAIRNEATHEILHLYLNAEEAKRTLGWLPLSTLDAGLLR